MNNEVKKDVREHFSLTLNLDQKLESRVYVHVFRL